MLFNEPKLLKSVARHSRCPRHSSSFSALQRAEIAEIVHQTPERPRTAVSVLFNEPKLLKLAVHDADAIIRTSFSALQRAEIAEIENSDRRQAGMLKFQCSSTSRNC